MDGFSFFSNGMLAFMGNFMPKLPLDKISSVSIPLIAVGDKGVHAFHKGIRPNVEYIHHYYK